MNDFKDQHASDKNFPRALPDVKNLLTDRGSLVFVNCCKLFSNESVNMSDTPFENNAIKHLQWVSCETFITHVMKEWDEWSATNIDVDCNLCERKTYQNKCQDFLIQTGYFHKNSIDKIVPRLGGMRMGGQYSIRWALSDFLYQKP